MSRVDKYRQRQVVVVDEKDNELGIAGIIEAHRDGGKKHRALSLGLWRERGGQREWLLQKRSKKKIVFPGLWANTCCYNLAPGEEYLAATVKRVKEELGIEIKKDILRIAGRFSYWAEDKDGWCENEVDTVIVGEVGGELKISPNEDEVETWRWVKEEEIKGWMKERPADFAPWFFQVWEFCQNL